MTDRKGPLEERDGAVLLWVRAAPRASREGVQGTHAHGAALKVAVRAAPARGKANAALSRAIAAAFEIRASQVLLESGKSSRDKCFRIEGASRTELERRLEAILHDLDRVSHQGRSETS